MICFTAIEFSGVYVTCLCALDLIGCFAFDFSGCCFDLCLGVLLLGV